MKEEITDWFNQQFWPSYPNDLCDGRKGPKGEALNEMLKYAPDQTERERIMGNLLAHIKADRKFKALGKFLERWPHARRYIRNRWWDNEVKSLNDTPAEKPTKEHRKCECGRETEYLYPLSGKFYCSRCYDENAHPEFKKKVYENLCNHGLGKLKDETREQWLQRIKQTGLKSLRKFSIPKQ